MGHDHEVYSLDFARDGRTIASGSGDRTVRIWDLETGACNLTLTIEDGVTSVAISPDTKLVAAGALDKIVRVWDLRLGYLLQRLEGHEDTIYSVAFSPSARELVSGSLDKTIRMWELATSQQEGGHAQQPPLMGGHCINTFEGHRVGVVHFPSLS